MSLTENTPSNERSVFDTFEADPERYGETLRLLNRFMELVTHDRDPGEVEEIFHALEGSMTLHIGQKDRIDGPYVNHILRVTIKLIEEFKRRKTSQIIAALYHDTVEDRPVELVLEVTGSNIGELSAAKQWKKSLQTLRSMQNKYGYRVRRSVRELTNRPKVKTRQSPEEKIVEYVVHVARAIEDVEAAPIKASDFSDNALKAADEKVEDILKIPDAAKKEAKLQKIAKLMLKYLPTIAIFERRWQKGDITNAESFLRKLASARQKMITALPILLAHAQTGAVQDFDSDAFLHSMVNRIDERLAKRKQR